MANQRNIPGSGSASSYSSDDSDISSGASSYSSEEPGLGTLFGELASQMSTLVRYEVSLAKTEMTDKATEAGKNVGWLAVGGVIAHMGLLALVAALIMALDEIMPTGAAAAVVGLALAALGYVFVQKGLSGLKDINLKPEATLESLKEDKEWAQRQIK